VGAFGAGVVPGPDANDARADDDLPSRPFAEHRIPACLLLDRRQQVGNGFDQLRTGKSWLPQLADVGQGVVVEGANR
jgi:hypothetical protein